MPPPLGRRHAPDPRDLNHPMRLQLDPFRDQFFPTGIPPGSRYYNPGPVLDQGATGCCVAFGWTGKANAAPIMQMLPFTPFDLYRAIVQIDEFPDNDFEKSLPDDELQSGTSVRAGAKAMQKGGYLSRYLWAQSVEDSRAWHLAGFGGTVIGVNWTSQMFKPDSDGFISYTGTIEGGHCVETTGWNDHVLHNGKPVRAVRIQNSWGRSWGQNGRAWIAEDDLARLMADDGEVCAASELRVR